MIFHRLIQLVAAGDRGVPLAAVLTPEMASCHDPSVESAAPDAYEREILAFRAARENRYRSDEGWLTLVERIPLEAGANPTPIGTIDVPGRGDEPGRGE